MFEWIRRRQAKAPQTPPHLPSASIQPSIHAFWIQVQGSELGQGDYLPRCLVPKFHPDFGSSEGLETVQVAEANLIVMTQSCDLENRKVDFVALCPISEISLFEQFNPQFAKKKSSWEEVRKGRHEGLHLLASPTNPQDNRKALVVDFRQIFSLPFAYLSRHAGKMGIRHRLQPPFLEHFSQAFARFFMRVGLPSAVPPFK